MKEMNSYRQHLIEEATMAKEMNLVWMNLEKVYLSFDETEKSMADRVLIE